MSISSIYEKTNQGRKLNLTWNAILTIAGRDVTRFVREPMRLAFSLILPLILIGGLAGPMQNNFGSAVHYSLITFTMTGLLAMTLFQTAMSGLMSLIEDRENDFTQELFIAPISRYAIVFGKILGESLVALVQGVVLLLVGVLVFGVPMSFSTLLFIVPVSLITCLLGGSFGVLLVSLFSNQRTANMVMPFLMFPQFFLAGIFLPLHSLPWYLDILSRITPMRYAVDLMRGIFYAGRPEAADVILMHPLFNLIIIAVLFTLFLCVGTFFFVRAERNR